MSAIQMNPAEAAHQAAVAKRAKVFWTGMILGLLGLQVGLCVVGVVMATRTRVPVEPNYYNKGLNWDQQRAEQAASDQLKWTSQLIVTEGAKQEHHKKVTLTLVDADGKTVENVVADVMFYHKARPTDVTNARLTSTSPGVYSAEVPLRYAGWYEFEVKAQRGAQVFLKKTKLDVE